MKEVELMDRNEFLKGDVKAFVEWLAARLPKLEVRLRFPHSNFVPGGIDTVALGIEDVLARYRWSASWTDARTGERVASCDWASTRYSLERLSAWLRESVENGDEAATGLAAREVLRWGGVRGAIPFIEAKVKKNAWCAYLKRLAPLFALCGKQKLGELNADNVERFDSGLTKIHALYDTTGSPIYDSRVGAALAMLYEMFRREGGVHEPLGFPSGRAQGQQIRDPGELGFAPAPQFYKRQVSHHDWARWQLRAGWIIRAVLERTQLFSNESPGAGASDIAGRCHAVEAAMFMIGYDLRSLVGGNEFIAVANAPRARRRAKQSGNWVPTVHPFSTVLKAYREYRETLPTDIGRAGLRKWLQEPAQAQRFPAFAGNAFSSYCYPFRETEFNLFDRTLVEISEIEDGGEKGLTTANYGVGQFVEADEREQVCLVCAGLAGYCELAEAAEAPRDRLVRKGLAGSVKSAGNLLNVGSGVGKHFGLLDRDGKPTAWFHRFYGDGFDHFRNRLGVDREGRDMNPV